MSERYLTKKVLTSRHFLSTRIPSWIHGNKFNFTNVADSVIETEAETMVEFRKKSFALMLQHTNVLQQKLVSKSRKLSTFQCFEFFISKNKFKCLVWTLKNTWSTINLVFPEMKLAVRPLIISPNMHKFLKYNTFHGSSGIGDKAIFFFDLVRDLLLILKRRLVCYHGRHPFGQPQPTKWKTNTKINSTRSAVTIDDGGKEFL